MSYARTLSLAVVAFVGLGLPVHAGEADQANLQILLDTIRANRKALVAANLQLTDTEAAGFWPLYDRYQGELNGIQDRAAKVIEEYIAGFSTIGDAKALTLAKDWLAAESDRARVRQTYLDQFAKVLPGRKVVRFYQIENKMDAVIRFDLAAEIPVVEQ
ncbi:MAG: hypothetical protein KIT14_01960 [bacterium]|nr:hypothetical protein [bacterium]